jgi:hypothetical protein
LAGRGARLKIDGRHAPAKIIDGSKTSHEDQTGRRLYRDTNLSLSIAERTSHLIDMHALDLSTHWPVSMMDFAD